MLESLAESVIERPYRYRQLSRWLHLTTTSTLQIVVLFSIKSFKFCIPGEVKITTDLISMSQAKPEGFW